MSWIKGLDLSRAFHLLVQAVDVISHITTTTEDDDAPAALRSIGEALKHLKDGAEGKVSIEAAEHALAELKDRLKTADDAADAKLHDRFDPGH